MKRKTKSTHIDIQASSWVQHIQIVSLFVSHSTVQLHPSVCIHICIYWCAYHLKSSFACRRPVGRQGDIDWSLRKQRKKIYKPNIRAVCADVHARQNCN